MAHETLRCEWVRCGKSNCRSCPHGPYWYAYWREDGRVRKRYIGKGDPCNRGETANPPGPESGPHPHDEIFSDQTATLALAFAILGIPSTRDMNRVKARLRELTLLHHPDRGGDPREMARINSAVAFIRRVLG